MKSMHALFFYFILMRVGGGGKGDNASAMLFRLISKNINID